MAGTATEYEPGTCNIGERERRTRFASGLVGFFLAIAYLGIVIVLDWPAHYALAVVVFVYPGVIGILQSILGFCVMYGFRGQYNFGRLRGDNPRVNRKSDRLKDRQHAIQIAVGGLIVSILITAGAYFVVATL